MAYFKIKGQSASAGYATGEYGGPRTDIIEAADRDGALEAAVRSGFYRKGLTAELCRGKWACYAKEGGQLAKVCEVYANNGTEARLAALKFHGYKFVEEVRRISA
ncbi:hypothetical protein HMPREF7215_0587 [Pyramidobacter piscolens W5455]|uniref:Uncharacterized protein n=1 Tax=Pyramidobacter piscolens W5455 TaxID=352165 RepID=A0ABP2HTI0_9BACT|nr:hypothetical protein [Pyramidobacter piscolens]EFB89599.1 hypothetical protein HMPREF7215_0587 [Pyramidobacter piscolens W5455]BDF78128.1 hypothetical protein CE91St28_09220 [Pyramidobacter piscolens]